MRLRSATLTSRDESVGGRVAAGDREFTGRLFFNIDVDDDTIGRRARLIGDLDGLEIVEVLQAALGAVDQRAVIGITLAEIEFAADHIVAGARVAADVDALDIGARAFLDDKRQIDGLGLEVAVAARPHSGKGIAVLGGLDRHRLNAFFNEVGVVDAARAQLELTAQRLPDRSRARSK